MDSRTVFEYKKLIQNAFKLSGFLLNSDLCVHIIEKAKDECDSLDDLREWVEKIIRNLQKQELNQPVLKWENIEEAIKECSGSNVLKVGDYLDIIPAFKYPKIEFDRDLRKFVQSDSTPKKHPEFRSKIQFFIERYNILLQQIERNDMFDMVTNRNKDTQLKLVTVEGLITSAAVERMNSQHLVVFGMLARLSDNKIYLEDPTGSVELDLKNAEFNVGIYTEGCFVVIDGEYDDNVLRVVGISHPPAETKSVGRRFTKEIDTFGGDLEKKWKQNPQLLSQIESQYSNHSFVLLSEIWLDSPQVISKLKLIFDGYNSCDPPFMFILMGNFTSVKRKNDPGYFLRDLFRQFGELLLKYEKLVASSIFLLIPGPCDPSCSRILPRRSFPPFITEEFQKRVPNSIVSTSPCRIRYCTKEIVIVREDIHSKMCRNAIHMPSDTDINLEFIKSIINQNHLTPMPPLLCPNYWDFDYTLSLYPLPDLLIVADDSKGEYTYDYKECKITNPGSFSKNNYSFQWYQPAIHEVENSGV